MPTQTVHVILNPKSGGGRGARLRTEIERELSARNVDVVLHETRAPGHARELAIEAVADSSWSTGRPGMSERPKWTLSFEERPG